MRETMRILMIGCGNMGGALLAQWQDKEWQHQNVVFTVVRPSGRALSPPLEAERIELVTGAEELSGRQFDYIVLATKPQKFADVLPDYKALLAAQGCYLSIAAGCSVRSINQFVGDTAIVRLMPNMPVAIGEGFTAGFANDLVSSEQRHFVDALMSSTGKLLWVDSEDQVDRATAIAGSGPGYVYEIARSWVETGESLGFSPAEARQMVLQTLMGSVSTALASDQPLARLRDAVTSKNGTTAAGLAALNGEAGLDRLLDQTVGAAYKRAVELR